jgi:hypothetical protein
LAVEAGGAATGGGSGDDPLARGRRRRRLGAPGLAGGSAAGRALSATAMPRLTFAPISPSAQSAPSWVCTSTRHTTIEDGAPPTGGRFWVSVQRA